MAGADLQTTDLQTVDVSPDQADTTATTDSGTESGTDSQGGHEIDLTAIERDLTDVQTALERLNDGNYWTDEVTGNPIPDDVLATHPTARTASPTLG